MTLQELETFLVSEGYVKDAYGHFHKGVVRFKIQKRTVRLERKYYTSDTQYSKGKLCYARFASGFLTRMKIVDGKIQGMTK